MKIFGGIIFACGLFLLAGVAGSADFYEECRAAVDCVAGEPMNFLQMTIQCIAGVVFLVGGIIMMIEE